MPFTKLTEEPLVRAFEGNDGTIQIYAGTTSIATGDGQAYFRVPSALNGMNLVSVAAAVVTAGVT